MLTLSQGTHKLGLGVSIETSPEELEAKMQSGEIQNDIPPPY